MRVNGLVSSLCFGAASAIALVFAQHLAAPLVGSSTLLAFYLAAATIAYAGLLGPTTGHVRHVIRNSMAALAGTIFVMLVSSEMAGLAIGLTCVLALVRSGLEFPQKWARGIWIETTLGVLGLGFASWVASPGWLGTAAGLWAFALVQSLYFLIPGRGHQRSEPETGDPFERAHERLLQLLEEV